MLVLFVHGSPIYMSVSRNGACQRAILLELPSCLGVPLSSARQSLKLLGNNLGQLGISLLRMLDDLIVVRLGITCFELAAGHIARRALLCKGLLSHDDRRIHLIIPFTSTITYLSSAPIQLLVRRLYGYAVYLMW